MNAAAYPTATVSSVEVFEAGEHLPGQVYTLQDLRDIQRNFRLALGYVDPPVKIGHEEDQPLVEGLAENTGDPAVGWVTNLDLKRRKGKDGRARWVLMADLHGVHPTVAGLINRRAYRKVSAEVYNEDQVPASVPAACRGKMLRSLALLGGTLPVVKTLADLPYAEFSEAGGRLATLRVTSRRRSPDGKAWRVFSEVTPMERSTLEDQLRALGWTDAQLAALQGVDDEAFGALVNATLATAAGIGDATPVEGEPPPKGEPPPPDEPLPDEGGSSPPDRATMESDLAAAGEDPETLAAMSDEEITALWQDKVGGGVPAMSETKKGAPAAVPTVAQFAELRRELAAIKRTSAVTFAEVSRRREAERKAAVGALCQRWSEQRYVLPAEVDPGSTKPNIYHRLMHASLTRVVKFGETSQTEYDAFVAEVEARGPGYAGRHFGERIKEAHKGAQHADVDKEVDDYVTRRYGKSRARAGA